MATDTADPPVLVAPSRYVVIPLAAQLTGLTAKAIERKIETGIWVEGKEYVRRDGRLFIDMRGYERWVERGRV